MTTYARVRMVVAITAIVASFLFVLPAAAQEGTMNIIIRVADKTIAAALNDTEAARSFASLLPLRVTLKDYAATEKIADLPKRLSTEGAPAGYDPAPGDITYYAPWGNLAIFYKDFEYSRGLVHLGKVDSGIDLLKQRGSIEATIELQRE